MDELAQLVLAAKTGNWSRVDIKKITPQIIIAPINNGNNILHIAAIEGLLEKVPKELLIEKGILALNKDRNSVLHLAAQFGGLHAVAKKLLTKEEELLVKNIEGHTVLNLAAMEGSLNLIPKKILTSQNLSLENERGENNLDYAFKHWDQNKKDDKNTNIKRGIDLIISTLTKDELKSCLKNTEDTIKMLTYLKSISYGTPPRNLSDESLAKYNIKKEIISKEIIKRALAKKQEMSLEI